MKSFWWKKNGNDSKEELRDETVMYNVSNLHNATANTKRYLFTERQWETWWSLATAHVTFMCSQKRNLQELEQHRLPKEETLNTNSQYFLTGLSSSDFFF